MFPPYGVKILWFVLSLIGLLGCWVVSPAFGRASGAFWAWTLYCVGSTILHGVFCIGIVWKMDPLLMPPAFCHLQTVLVALGCFLVTGVVATFSYMTNRIVNKPKTWGQQKHSLLNFQRLYLLPVAIFPLVFTIIYIVCVVTLKSVHPARDFFCDSSMPQWVRFMSYAGIPLLLSIPSLYLSCQGLHRALQITKHIQRARSGLADLDSTEPGSPPSSFRKPSKSKITFQDHHTVGGSDFKPPRPSSRVSATSSQNTSLRFAVSPPTVRNQFVRFHVPSFSSRNSDSKDQEISLTSLTQMSLNNSSEVRVTVGGGGGSSASLPLAVPEVPSARPSLSVSTAERKTSSEDGSVPSGPLNPPQLPAEDLEISPPTVDDEPKLESTRSSESTSEKVSVSTEWKDSLRVPRGDTFEIRVEGGDSDWNNVGGDGESENISYSGTVTAKGDDRKVQLGDEDSILDVEEADVDTLTRGPIPVQRTHSKQFNGAAITGRTRRHQLSYLAQPIWRMIVFQIAFVVVQFIGCLSTLIDVAKDRPAPTPLGTHHFSMLFVVWGPIIAFGSLACTRQHLIPTWIQTLHSRFSKTPTHTSTDRTI